MSHWLAAVLHVTANRILHYIYRFVRCTCSICLLDQPASLIRATAVTPSQTAQVSGAVGVGDAASAQHVCSLLVACSDSSLVGAGFYGDRRSLAAGATSRTCCTCACSLWPNTPSCWRRCDRFDRQERHRRFPLVMKEEGVAGFGGCPCSLQTQLQTVPAAMGPLACLPRALDCAQLSGRERV